MEFFLSRKKVAYGIPQALALGLHSFKLFILYNLEMGSTWSRKNSLPGKLTLLPPNQVFALFHAYSPFFFPFRPLLSIISQPSFSSFLPFAPRLYDTMLYSNMVYRYYNSTSLRTQKEAQSRLCWHFDL